MIQHHQSLEHHLEVPGYSAWLLFFRILIAMLLVAGVLGFWFVLFIGAFVFWQNWGGQ